MADDLMGLALIVVIAGGAFFLLTRNGNFSLGPNDADVYGTGDPSDDAGVDADVTGGGDLDASGLSKSAAKKSCSELCKLGWCTSHRLKYCSGCKACPTKSTGANCSALCKAVNCEQYRSVCPKAKCSNCLTSSKCKACRKGYVLKGPGCTCRLKSGATPQTFGKIPVQCPTGYTLRERTDIPGQYGCYPSSARARAYTGRVTFNPNSPTYGRENRPINPNSPTYGRENRPVNPNSPIYMRPSQAYLAQPWHRSISVS